MKTEVNHLQEIKRLLKHRMKCGSVNIFQEFDSEIQKIRNLLLRSSEIGESNSLLVIGPRGCGKTSIMNRILLDLLSQKAFFENSLIVSLNGILHTDDRIALKSITVQLDLENAAAGKSFGSFAENLAFLLDTLKAGNNKKSKSIMFVLDEFDLFCAHHNQTLLYNLFDVAQSAQAPICVIGLTYRLDVIELLEKRVKSRFSHRQIFIHPNGSAKSGVEKLKLFLKLSDGKEQRELVPVDRVKNKMLAFVKNQYNPNQYNIQSDIRSKWNKAVDKIFLDKDVQTQLEMFFDLDISINSIKIIAWEIISETINDNNFSFNVEKIIKILEDKMQDDKVSILCGLSVLEICLIIAMKHHTEIYDRDPFNFEMIYNRFNKFSCSSTTMQGMEKEVVLKAFEHLKILELLAPMSSFSSKQKKEFQLHKLLLTSNQIKQTVNNYQNLPVDVSQWALSSIM